MVTILKVSQKQYKSFSMFFLPLINITYQTDLSIEDIYSVLSKTIIDNPIFTVFKPLTLDPFEKDHNKYRGLINYRGFRVQRNSGFTGRMIIKGLFKEGSPLTIKVSYRRWHTFIFLFGLNSFLGFILFSIFYSNELHPWLVLIIGLILLIINIIPYRLFQYEIAIFEKFLEKTISATRVNKQDAS